MHIPPHLPFYCHPLRGPDQTQTTDPSLQVSVTPGLSQVFNSSEQSVTFPMGEARAVSLFFYPFLHQHSPFLILLLPSESATLLYRKTLMIWGGWEWCFIINIPADQAPNRGCQRKEADKAVRCSTWARFGERETNLWPLYFLNIGGILS